MTRELGEGGGGGLPRRARISVYQSTGRGRFRERSAPVIGEVLISATAAAPLAAKGVAGSKSKPGEMAGKEGDGQGSRRNAPILLSFIIHTTPSSAPVPWWRDLGRSPPVLDGLDGSTCSSRSREQTGR